MTQEEQKKIIDDCVANDLKAKKMLYDLYAAKMFMVCMRYANNREDAEDVLQDSFIKIFDNIGKFRNDGSLEGWIKRIVANTAIKHYHKKNPMCPVKSIEFAAEMEEEEGFMEKLSSNNTMKELLRMVQDLSPRYRMVFNLYAIEGYSHSEIAQLLEISEGTSKSQLSRAREILKNQINAKQKLKEEGNVSTQR